MTNFKALTPSNFTSPSFDNIHALYKELLDTPVSEDSLLNFLADLNNLDTAVSEAAAMAKITFDLDTNNTEASDLRNLWYTDILPRLSDIETELDKKILAIPGHPEICRVAFSEMRRSAELFKVENIPLESEIEDLTGQYDNLIGSLSVTVGGQVFTLPQIVKELESTDRSHREAVWRARAAALKNIEPELSSLWTKLWTLRTKLATNSGFSNFRDFVWAHDTTTGYTPVQSAEFFDSVKNSAVPLINQIREERRRSLGVETLRPWDLFVDFENLEPLDLGSDSKKVMATAKQILTSVAKPVGDLLEKMDKAGYLDLDNVPGKCPGGYNMSLEHSKAPFIFMNAVGSSDDLATLVHEMGHALHADLVLNSIPFHWAQHPGEEMCELASMSMELMAFEHLRPENSGFDANSTRRIKTTRLEDIITFLSHCTTIDQFQHDAYTNPSAVSLSSVNSLYLNRTSQVDVGVDWSGLEDLRSTRWHYQAHVWTSPFYYLQYGIAQLAALDIWRRYQSNPQDTFNQYIEALKLGHTKTLPDLFKAAGVKLDFSPSYMEPLLLNAYKEFHALSNTSPSPARRQAHQPKPSHGPGHYTQRAFSRL